MTKRRAPMTASDLMRELESDPDWVARRDAKERERAQNAAALRREQAPLLRDLAKSGKSVEDVWLLYKAKPYPNAFPVLLEHLESSYSDRNLEGIIQALAVKEARPVAWDALIAVVRKGSLPKGATEGAMAAISAMAKPADLPALIELITDRSLGLNRMLLVRNLMRSKKPEARQTLLELRDDPDLQKEIAVRLRSRPKRPHQR